MKAFAGARAVNRGGANGGEWPERIWSQGGPEHSYFWRGNGKPLATRVPRQNRLLPPPIDCQNLASQPPPLIVTCVCRIVFSRSRQFATQSARRIGNAECGVRFEHNNQGESHAKNSALCPHGCYSARPGYCRAARRLPRHRRQPKQRASQYSTMPSARMRR
jgi:hypothetical protein